MGTINWTRVILGGLVAGVVINVFESVLNGVVLAKDWEAAMARPSAPSSEPRRAGAVSTRGSRPAAGAPLDRHPRGDGGGRQGLRLPGVRPGRRAARGPVRPRGWRPLPPDRGRGGGRGRRPLPAPRPGQRRGSPPSRITSRSHRRFAIYTRKERSGGCADTPEQPNPSDRSRSYCAAVPQGNCCPNTSEGKTAAAKGSATMSYTGLTEFDNAVQKTNTWLKDMMERMRWRDRHRYLTYESIRDQRQEG